MIKAHDKKAGAAILQRISNSLQDSLGHESIKRLIAQGFIDPVALNAGLATLRDTISRLNQPGD